MGREGKNQQWKADTVPHVGHLQKGEGRLHRVASRGQLYSNRFCFNSSPLVSKLVFVAGEERHGRGSAAQHQEPQTLPD